MLEGLSQEFNLGEVLSGLYKQLQALRLKVSYGIGAIYGTQGTQLRELKKTAKQTRKVLEQTDLSRKFHEFPWVSMRFYAHAPRRLRKIPIV